MASAMKTTKKTYTYRSGVGGNTNTDVSIEYSADLSALSRMEVKIKKSGRNKSKKINEIYYGFDEIKLQKKKNISYN